METETIQTVRLRNILFKNEIQVLSEAFMKNKIFTNLDLSQVTNVLNPESMMVLADAIKETNFSKILTVSSENQKDLLNELLPCKEDMSLCWTQWMNPLWEEMTKNIPEEFVNAINNNHQNLAHAIAKMDTFQEFNMVDKYLTEQSTTLLVDTLKVSTGLQRIQLDDDDHKIFMGLIPFKASLSQGVQNWIESRWSEIIENQKDVMNHELNKTFVNEEFVNHILTKGNITTLHLSEMWEYKIFRFFNIIKNNSTLEDLKLSGKISSPQSLLSAIVGKLFLKNLDLSDCEFQYKIDKAIFNDLESSLKKHEKLNVIFSPKAFEEEDLQGIRKSSFVSEDSEKVVIGVEFHKL
jgi:hypothetical protein